MDAVFDQKKALESTWSPSSFARLQNGLGRQPQPAPAYDRAVPATEIAPEITPPLGAAIAAGLTSASLT
jgi:hypothetical protein